MKTPDNPLPFEPDEGEEILWALHKPLPGGSMKLRILLWCVAVVLGILALALLSSDFALAFVLGVVALLCVSGAEHSCTNAPHRISYVLSNRRAFIIETPVKRGKPATVITFRVRRNMVGRVLHRSSGHVDYHLGREVMEEEEDLPRGLQPHPGRACPGRLPALPGYTRHPAPAERAGNHRHHPGLRAGHGNAGPQMDTPHRDHAPPAACLQHPRRPDAQGAEPLRLR